MLTEIAGSRNRTGGLSVSLASPDGRVIGGGVGGMLIAAGPVQVAVSSWLAFSYSVRSVNCFHSKLLLSHSFFFWTMLIFQWGKNLMRLMLFSFQIL